MAKELIPPPPPEIPVPATPEIRPGLPAENPHAPGNPEVILAKDPDIPSTPPEIPWQDKK